MNLKALSSAAALSFTVALGGMVAAQSAPPGQSGTPQQKPAMQPTDAKTVTVTGCLVRASDLRGAAGAATTAPAAAPAGGGGDFVLANVQMRSAAPGGTTTGGTDTTAPSAPGMNLRLTGSEQNKLTEHVNHRVEITGQLSMRDAKSGEAGAAAGTTGAPATPGAAAGGQNTAGQLQVQSIRATGESCKPVGQ